LERGIRLNILITGSNGFVGKSLLETLLSKKEYLISAVVRDKKNYLPSDYRLIEIKNFSEKGIWKGHLKDIDVIVHTAGRAHKFKKRSKESLKEYQKDNVSDTLNLAKQAAKSGVKRFIFLSSIKVNGEETISGKKFKPEDTPKPEDFYAISKLEAEKGLFDLSEKTKMEIVCIRPPLIYGPGVKGNLALLIRFIRKGIPLPLASITSNRRSLVSLTNLTSLIEVCLLHPKAANEVFLVSDDEDLSTSELILKLSKAIKKPVRLLGLPLPLLKFLLFISQNERLAHRLLSNLQVDITKTINLLEWSPTVNLEQGLRSIIDK